MEYVDRPVLLGRDADAAPIFLRDDHLFHCDRLGVFSADQRRELERGVRQTCHGRFPHHGLCLVLHRLVPSPQKHTSVHGKNSKKGGRITFLDYGLWFFFKHMFSKLVFIAFCHGWHCLPSQVLLQYLGLDEVSRGICSARLLFGCYSRLGSVTSTSLARLFKAFGTAIEILEMKNTNSIWKSISWYEFLGAPQRFLSFPTSTARLLSIF